MIKDKSNEFLINSEVNQYLKDIVETKIFNNGYIFFGAEGLGKKYTAIRFIKDIFNKCSTSKNIEEKIANNNHPDFLVIEPLLYTQSKSTKNLNISIPKNNNQVIKIDQIRNIKKFLSQKSIESEKKIVLIHDAHLLNEAASNCLLKTLEEPSNAIIILLTSKLNLLLDTIKSRCQKVKFKSFSSRQIEIFLKKNLDSSKLIIYKNINIQDLVNSANGSPGKLLYIIDICNQLPEEILSKLTFPIKEHLEILKIAKLISEQLEIFQQIGLINLIQQIWWRKTNNAEVIQKLEFLKSHLNNKIQPRLAWEVSLLKISIEDL